MSEVDIPRKSYRRLCTKVLLGSLAGLSILVAACASYRAQRRVPEQVRQWALQQGYELEYGAISSGPFTTAIRNVKLRIAKAPFVAVTIDAMTVRGALFGARRLAIEKCRLTLSGEPSLIFDGLQSIPRWTGVSVSWGELDVEYEHRVFGHLSLDGVRAERKDGTLVVSASQVRLGAARWQDVLFSVHRRNQMIEIGLSDPAPKTAQTQLGYFSSTRGVSQWTLSLVHQPARPFAERLGWDPGPNFDSTRIAGTLSFVVPDDRSQPIRGLLQMVLDRWPRPNWQQGEALLGNTASFLARITPSEDMLRWDLVHTDLSLSLFTMIGTGRILLGQTPSIAFDVRGTRTCAQIQGNTAPSIYLNQVNAYLEQPPAIGGADRRLDEAALRLQLLVERAADGKRHVAWHLEPGCGLTELSEGAFISWDLPPKQDPAKR